MKTLEDLKFSNSLLKTMLDIQFRQTDKLFLENKRLWDIIEQLQGNLSTLKKRSLKNGQQQH